MALVSRTDYLLEASKANAHWLLSGFKNFKINTFIYKPDRMKFETFSVPGPSTDGVSQFSILRKVAWHFKTKNCGATWAN